MNLCLIVLHTLRINYWLPNINDAFAHFTWYVAMGAVFLFPRSFSHSSELGGCQNQNVMTGEGFSRSCRQTVVRAEYTKLVDTGFYLAGL